LSAELRGVGVIRAQDTAGAGQGVLVEGAGLFMLTQPVQVEGKLVRRCECVRVIRILLTAQYERRLIVQRTRNALAAKREQGVRLGRPQALSDDVVQRIVAARNAGSSFHSIAGAA
jgi:hypothetical protein